MQNSNAYKKRAEYLKMVKKNYLFEQIKPKLKEIFDHVDRSGTSTISIIEIKEALQLLNIGHAVQKLDSFEDLLANSKDSLTKSDLTFEDFTNLCLNLLDFNDIQYNLKDCLVFDFLDPSSLTFTSDNTIVNKDFSLKVLDESIVLRMRIEMKYSIYANNVEQNIKILKNVEKECAKRYADSPYLDSFLKYSYSLRDCWAWIGKCIENRRSSFDFTRGLRNLMANLYENNEDNSDQGPKVMMMSYLVYSGFQRSEVLNLLGWSFIEHMPKQQNFKLHGIVEQEENPARAAALCVFHFDFPHAFKCLDEMKNPNSEVSFVKSILKLLKDWQTSLLQDRDVSSLIYYESSRHSSESEETAGLPYDFSNEVSQNKTKATKLEAIKRDLKVIQNLCTSLDPKDPYFRAICKFIGNSEPPVNIIKDHNLSFMDRVAFAYRFLSPKALEGYLTETIDEAKEKGYLGALLLVGKSPEGFEIIQNYLDNTADIQSIALIGVYLRLFRFPNEDFYKGLLSNYKGLMDRLKYWEDRIGLQTKIMELEKSFADAGKDRKAMEQIQEQSGYSASQRCYYCNSSLAHPTLLNQLSESKKSFAQMHKYEKTRINFCPDCLKPLPNCAICLLPVAVLNPYIELQEKIKRVTSKKENTAIDMDEALIWCQQCKHGGHVLHVAEWFQTHTKCPVSGCICECTQIDYQ